MISSFKLAIEYNHLHEQNIATNSILSNRFHEALRCLLCIKNHMNHFILNDFLELLSNTRRNNVKDHIHVSNYLWR